MKEVYLYKKLKENKVKCQNCSHYCTIAKDKKGICGVRKNENGKLYSLNYNKACALNIDPIEKKPFFHFLPGTRSLSLATVGCNFACHSCQNYSISQDPKINARIKGDNIPPEEIIATAKNYKTPSISYTYTEPAIFSEYALDIMKLAKKEGVKNNWVSNGFWSEELFEMVSPYLDAVNVDLKSFSNEFYQKYCSGKLEPVLKTLKRIKQKNIWLEVTTLIIPGLNDSDQEFKKIARFIKNKLGQETPWHLSRFSGAISWKLKDVPQTPIKTLEKAYQTGKEVGLNYIYTGNTPALYTENTFCPNCGQKIIDRASYSINQYHKKGKCPDCGQKINIIIK